MSRVTGMPILNNGFESLPPARQASNASAASRPPEGGKTLPAQTKPGNAPATGVDKAVVQVNQYLQQQNRTLEFSVDKSTGQTVVKIIDQVNGKVIRQIPPEYMLQLAQTLLEHNRVNSVGVKVKT